MANDFFKFRKFTINQGRSAMKVATDSCLFGSLLPSGHSALRALDIGAGTGLLSLMFAQKNPNATIDAIEIDTGSSEDAIENVRNSGYSSRIRIINEDIRRFKHEADYDVIFTNPPFYESELRSADPTKNIAHHSDQLKLSELVHVIANMLVDDGEFFILFTIKRYDELARFIRLNNLFIHKEIYLHQSPGHEAFRIVIRGKGKPLEKRKAIRKIVIWDDHERYTSEFTELLKDYYLHL